MPVPVHPLLTLVGVKPVTVNVPSGFVDTDPIYLHQVPVNVTVFRATPAPPTLSVSLPVTVTVVPDGTLAIGFNVRLVE